MFRRLILSFLPAVFCAWLPAGAAEIGAASAADFASAGDRRRVAVGGAVHIGEFYGRYDVGPRLEPSGRRSVSPADFAPEEAGGNPNKRGNRFQPRLARLDLRFDASDRFSLRLGLDLMAARDGVCDEGDLLEYAYFELREIGNPGLSLAVGKQAMPFGLHIDTLLVSPWIANRPERLDGFDGWFGDPGRANPSARGFDRAFGVAAKQTFLRDLASVELGLFQRRADCDGRNGGRRIDDALDSVAARFIFAPLEGGALYASFANLHDDAAKDRFRGRANQQRHSLGLELKPSIFWFTLPLDFFVECQWGRGDDFLDDGASRDVHAGLVWHANARWRLNLQGEWLRARGSYPHPGAPDAPADAAASRSRRQNDFHRAVIAAEYEWAEGMVFEFGWQRQWLRSVQASSRPPAPFDAVRWSGRGDLIYFGVKYGF